MRRARFVLAPVLLAVTSGCSLAPPLVVPQVDAPDVFKEAPGWTRANGTAGPTREWWKGFGDPRLDGLEARVEVENQTLAAAIARYAQAMATVRRSRAEGLPQIEVGADIGRERLSANRPVGNGTSQTYNQYQAGASLSFELDVFQRIRNSVRANTSAAEASEADVAAVRLGLQAGLATLYFELRGIDARILLLRETVSAFERAYTLTVDRHEGGIGSGLDVGRADSQLSSARAELNALIADRARAEHGLAIFVGENPSSFTLAPGNQEITVPDVPAIVPSTVIQNRPDILAAEHRVAEANYRIGVARAALFPVLGLGGGGGFDTSGHNMLAASSRYWALGPLSASLSIFDGGARRANVKISQAAYDEIAANYRQTVLTAFREVEDNLASGRQMALQERDLRRAAQAAGRTQEIALDRYRDGASDYLDVVTAQAAALDAARALLTVQNARLGNAADTVRALGGYYESPKEGAPITQ